jgi:hypothetical protein
MVDYHTKQKKYQPRRRNLHKVYQTFIITSVVYWLISKLIQKKGKYQNLIWFNKLYYHYLKIDLIHVLQKYEFNVYPIITIRHLYYKVFILMKVNTQILARSFDFCGDFVTDNLGSQTKPLTSFTFTWTRNWGKWLWCFTPHSTIFHWYRGTTLSKKNISRDEEICIKYIKRLLSLQLFIDWYQSWSKRNISKLYVLYIVQSIDHESVECISRKISKFDMI